jgi:hypothetical protein
MGVGLRAEHDYSWRLARTGRANPTYAVWHHRDGTMNVFW